MPVTIPTLLSDIWFLRKLAEGLMDLKLLPLMAPPFSMIKLGVSSRTLKIVTPRREYS
jgi:hypothetical protein